MRSSPRRTVLAFALLATTSAGAPIDFARDVYPIFQRSCFECHGEKKAKGSLRLHTREAAFDDDGVIVKGDAAASELFRRITLPKSDEEVMPNRGEPLSKDEIARIKAWINAGAPWPDGVKPQKHWAYVAPVRPPLPEVKTSAWPRNAIDRFVLARLESEGLSPSPEADRRRSAPPVPRSHRPAADARGDGCVRSIGRAPIANGDRRARRPPARFRNLACAGRGRGSISRATPTRTVSSATTCAISGRIATGWCAR